MFTGLIETRGQLARTLSRGPDTTLVIETDVALVEALSLGESIAVDGACLTVTRWGGRTFEVDASAETLSRTTLGERRVGAVRLPPLPSLGIRITSIGDFAGELLDDLPSRLGCRLGIAPDPDPPGSSVHLPIEVEGLRPRGGRLEVEAPHVLVEHDRPTARRNRDSVDRPFRQPFPGRRGPLRCHFESLGNQEA